MKPPEKIETKRLILRKPRMDDAYSLFNAYMQDLEVARFTMWRPHQRVEQTEEFIEDCLLAWESDARFPFVITLKEKYEPFGMIDFHIKGSTVGFGYVIARSHQCMGYATEATRAIIGWAFQQPSLYRVNASTDVENHASARVMEKAGMIREGLLRTLFIPILVMCRVIVICMRL